jgi:hypothetical protein
MQVQRQGAIQGVEDGALHRGAHLRHGDRSAQFGSQ